jgi:molybdenum cofactor synthesis domain-containing protein
MKAGVITCSNRSAAGERPDDSGALAAQLLAEAGHDVVGTAIVPDDIARIRSAVRAVLEMGARLVVTTGGTGLTPTDVTPEAVGPMLEREIPGVAETIRAFARERVPTSILSRGVAGTIGSAVVVTLPGSPGGVQDGLAVVLPIIDHLLDQIGGGDHRAGGGL